MELIDQMDSLWTDLGYITVIYLGIQWVIGNSLLNSQTIRKLFKLPQQI